MELESNKTLKKRGFSDCWSTKAPIIGPIDRAIVVTKAIIPFTLPKPKCPNSCLAKTAHKGVIAPKLNPNTVAKRIIIASN